MGQDVQEKFDKIADSKKCSSLRFLKVEDSEGFKNRLTPLNAFLSSCGYLSLYIPSVLSGYDRVVYVDAHVMLTSDISQIFHVNMGDCIIAGHATAGASFTRNLLHGNEEDAYVNAGLLLWNIKESPSGLVRSFSDSFNTGTVQYAALDFQDIVNRALKGKIYSLPGAWKRTGKGYFCLSGDQKENAASSEVGEAVHFYMPKPWVDCNSRMARLWFANLKKTSFSNSFPGVEKNLFALGARFFYSILHKKLQSFYNRKIKEYVLAVNDVIFRKDNAFIRGVRDKLLKANSARQSRKNFDISQIDAKNAPVLTFERQTLYIGNYGIKHTYHALLNTRKIRHYDAVHQGDFAVAFFNVFRNSGIRKQIDLLLMRLTKDFALYFIECGFLQSVTNVNDHSIPLRFRRVNSYIVDDMGFYFDATIPSRIETYLNSSDSELDQERSERAAALIRRVREARLTKYNYQPVATNSLLEMPGRKVLVVDQSRKDASIIRGMADQNTFSDMLDAALAENPDATVIIKTHPDSIARQRGCYYADVKSGGRIHKITESINPYSVLEAVDKVYVCTSQLGLEALFCGKEVAVFGMPGYAGWGLTHDILSLERRVKKHTIEDLAYAFLIKFCVYFDPITGERCEVEEFVEKMILLRDQYISEFGDKEWNCSR